MIDDDDAWLALIVWPVLGPVSLIVGIIVCSFLFYRACENDKACTARECPTGQSARLLEGECLCVAGPR